MINKKPAFCESNNRIGTTELVLAHMFGLPDVGAAHVKKYLWAIFLKNVYGIDTFHTPKEPRP